ALVGAGGLASGGRGGRSRGRHRRHSRTPLVGLRRRHVDLLGLRVRLVAVVDHAVLVDPLVDRPRDREGSEERDQREESSPHDASHYRAAGLPTKAGGSAGSWPFRRCSTSRAPPGGSTYGTG